MRAFYDVSLSYNVKKLSTFNIRDSNIENNEFVNAFKNISSEFFNFEVVNDESIQCKRFFLGIFKLKCFDDNNKNILKNDIKVHVFVTDFINSKYAIINLLFYNINEKNISYLLDNAQQNLLLFTNTNELFSNFFEKKYNIKFLTTPKSCVSFYDENFQEKKLVYFLSHQSIVSNMLDDGIISPKFINYANTNLSQYNGCIINISNCSVVQRLVNNIVDKLENRLTYMILTIFMIELLELKECYLLDLRNDLLNHKINEKLSINNTVELNSKLLQINKLWNINFFIYPITQTMFELFEERFMLKKMKKEYIELENSFERLISITETIQNEKNSLLLNNILFIIAFIQICPIIFEIFLFNFNKFSILYLLSSISCFIVLFICEYFINKK